MRDSAVSYSMFILRAWCFMSVWYMAVGGGSKIRTSAKIGPEMAYSSHEAQYSAIRGGPQRSVGDSDPSYSMCIWYVLRRMSILYVAAGGGRGATKERRRPRLTRQWRILRLKRNIYLSAGIRSDPWAYRRFRTLCLFGTYGDVCRFGTWRRAAGWGKK